MNKILLTIIGVVTLTAGNIWGQSQPDDIVFQNLTFTNESGQVFDFSGGDYIWSEASWGNEVFFEKWGEPFPVAEEDIGPNSADTYKDKYNITIEAFSPDSIYMRISKGRDFYSMGGWDRYEEAHSLEGFVTSPDGPFPSNIIQNPGTALSALPVFASWLATQGGGSGEPQPDGTSDSSSTLGDQAASLNDGLTFQDGQWTPDQ